MNRNQQSIPVVIPPALDADESELAARNEFLAEKDLTGANDLDEFANTDEEADEIILDETDAAPGGSSDEREAKNLRHAKRRKSLMFLTVFGAGFGVFVVFLAWIFGIGFFAPAKRVSVDRNQKPNGVNSSSAATNGDEKLKTALALVAGEAGNNQNSPIISDASINSNALPERDLKLTSGDKTGEQANNQTSGNMIVLPDENSSGKSNGAQNQIRVAQSLSQGTVNTTAPNSLLGEVPPTKLFTQPKSNKNGIGSIDDKFDGSTPARSVFFGSGLNKNASVPPNSLNNSNNVPLRNSGLNPDAANVPVFGTLLPVRLLGAIYTLQRGTGGLVRMELSRSVRKGAFAYPAGTIIIGRLRGSEYNRAFVSATGAIDPKSGKLVKFEGEVLGVDGASGVSGTRKSIKSWGARFLSGLREAGGQAVNVLTARGVGGGRGGTIVLGGTGGLGGEMSRVVRGDTQENSFVMVRAGTEAYVSITDLPAEGRGDELEKVANANNQFAGLNLTEPEMAEILSTDDPNKIRAVLLKMSPQFRALAIKAIEEGDK